MISVIVCTAGRKGLLAQTLDQFIDKFGSDSRVKELIIVDDSYRAKLKEFITLFSKRFSKIQYVAVGGKGLSVARNRGVLCSSGEIIAFLDDDTWVEDSWIEGIEEAFSCKDVWCAGGPIEPIITFHPPKWFKEEWWIWFTVWDRGNELHELEYPEFPRGANMAFRRKAFDYVGLFSTSLGRKRGSLLSCEEIELALRIARSGKKIVYSPLMKVKHHVPYYRVRRLFFIKRIYYQGISDAILVKMHYGFREVLRNIISYSTTAENRFERLMRVSYKLGLSVGFFVALKVRGVKIG